MEKRHRGRLRQRWEDKISLVKARKEKKVFIFNFRVYWLSRKISFEDFDSGKRVSVKIRFGKKVIRDFRFGNTVVTHTHTHCYDAAEYNIITVSDGIRNPERAILAKRRVVYAGKHVTTLTATTRISVHLRMLAPQPIIL